MLLSFNNKKRDGKILFKAILIEAAPRNQVCILHCCVMHLCPNHLSQVDLQHNKELFCCDTEVFVLLTLDEQT